MKTSIQNIVIVGGGTAGWLTAASLAAKFKQDEQFQITLVESPNIATIGVGEGTWPSMAGTLRRIGISENEFIRECDASFKQGTRFIGWRTTKADSYYHPFSLPLAYSEINLPDHWLSASDEGDFGSFATPQTAVCDKYLAPKQASTPEYANVLNYGYHLNAGKFARLLKKHSIEKLGLNYISDDVVKVIAAENEDIKAVVTATNGQIEGDLFIDCTGFNALMINKHYAVPYVSYKDVIFNDSAIATQVPHEDDDSPISSTTNATAHETGWIWDIALPTRRGIGIVYSSRHSDESTAEATLAEYLKKHTPHVSLNQLTSNKIPIDPGHRQHFWHRNCVAVGLSAGFIDPLEATAMVLIELSARFITDHLPANKEQMPYLAERYNQRFLHHWENIISFIKLHYVLSQRDDSDYWRDHRKLENMPAHLRTQLEVWKQRPPWHADLDLAEQMFPPASYQYILYGMGFESLSGLENRRQSEQEKMHMKKLQEQMRLQRVNLLTHLPTNRQLLQSIRAT